MVRLGVVYTIMHGYRSVYILCSCKRRGRGRGEERSKRERERERGTEKGSCSWYGARETSGLCIEELGMCG